MKSLSVGGEGQVRGFAKRGASPSTGLRQARGFAKHGASPSTGLRQARGGEMLPMLAVGSRALVLRSKETGSFREVAGVFIVDLGGLCLW